MKGSVPVNITRMRIETIQSRTEETRLPKIERVYDRAEPVSGNLTRNFVETMTYSSYPDARAQGATTLRAFLMNTRNIKELKDSGSLGAIFEGLHNIVASSDSKSNLLLDLVNSLELLTRDDTIMQSKVLSHPYGVRVLLKLCTSCDGTIQSILFDIIERIIKLPSGVEILLQNKIIEVLMAPEFLFRKSTMLQVRHDACRMINFITTKSPGTFPPDVYMHLSLDEHGVRRIDGVMEMQLLNALLTHLNWLEQNNFELGYILTIVTYYLNEIIAETFENLDHLQQIIKIVVILSKDTKHSEFMLKHSLAVALQFLVSTDFSVYRKKQVSKSGEHSSLKSPTQKVKRLSIQDTGERPKATLQALTVIAPNSAVNRTDDINHLATKAVITVFENIIAKKVAIITEIVSSTLIPALLYRVGKGTENDMRFNKMFVSFLYCILTKAVQSQVNPVFKISSLSVLPGQKVRQQRSGGRSNDDLPESSAHGHSRAKSSRIDLYGISNTLHAQGVTKILFASLQYSDEVIMSAQALACLSLISFGVIALDSYVSENISRVCHLCATRSECYFPALGIIAEMIMYPAATEEDLLMLLEQMKVIKLLVKALRLAGWAFPMALKDEIYSCLVKLSVFSSFRAMALTSGGMTAILREVKGRRTRINRAKAAQSGEEVDKMIIIFKYDIVALKLQQAARAWLHTLESRK